MVCIIAKGARLLLGVETRMEELNPPLTITVRRKVAAETEERIYRCTHKIGAGGWGTVYLAEQVSPEAASAVVAVKIAKMAIEPDQVAAMIGQQPEEAKVLEQCQDVTEPGQVVPLEFWGIHNNQSCLVMQYIAGKPVTEYCQAIANKDAERSLAQKLYVLERIARTVAAVHDKGIIHRDLKPGNILVTGDGIPWLLDFGIAKELPAGHSLHTLSIYALGTPHYSAPEQEARKTVGAACDLWALGVMLYELIEKGVPFAENDDQVRMQKKNQSPSGIKFSAAWDKALRKICCWALQADSRKRPPSAETFADALRDWRSACWQAHWHNAAAVLRPGFWHNVADWQECERQLRLGAGFISVAEGQASLSDWQGLFAEFWTARLGRAVLLQRVGQKLRNVELYRQFAPPVIPLLQQWELQLLGSDRLCYLVYPRPLRERLKHPLPASMAGTVVAALLAALDQASHLGLRPALPKANEIWVDVVAETVSIVACDWPEREQDPSLAEVKALLQQAVGVPLPQAWPAVCADPSLTTGLALLQKLAVTPAIAPPPPPARKPEPTPTPAKSQAKAPALPATVGSAGTEVIPSDIWQACWKESAGYFDFTLDNWVKELQHAEQFKYAKAYQAWYAKTQGLQIEKTLSNMAMRLIPPGKFWMGSPDDETDRSDNETRHRVLISKPFYIGKYAVTQAQWLAVMGKNPSCFTEAGSDAPVEYVSWEDIKFFEDEKNKPAVKKEDTFLAKLEKLGAHFDLPTEAQWEYACRAGTTYAFNIGNNITPAQMNYNGNYPYNNAAIGDYREKTVPVGSLLHENAWGCFDFHGNVWEWCQDWHGAYPSGEVTDPPGTPTGSCRVDRGGSWRGNAQYCRSANRDGSSPVYRGSLLGFRPVGR
jgi:formylglycine-generating enzyme required for sulfatase activity/tRNA A-37 threonylcarbamoyl transferase component Bud32